MSSIGLDSRLPPKVKGLPFARRQALCVQHADHAGIRIDVRYLTSPERDVDGLSALVVPHSYRNLCRVLRTCVRGCILSVVFDSHGMTERHRFQDACEKLRPMSLPGQRRSKAGGRSGIRCQVPQLGCQTCSNPGLGCALSSLTGYQIVLPGEGKLRRRTIAVNVEDRREHAAKLWTGPFAMPGIACMRNQQWKQVCKLRKIVRAYGSMLRL